MNKAIKRKAVPLIVAAMLILSAATVYGATTKYKGFDIAALTFNGYNVTFQGVPSFIVDGKPVAPVDKVVQLMEGILIWDSKTKSAEIYKPQVNIMFAETEDGKTPIGAPLNYFPIQRTNSFLSYVSIGNLPTGDYSIFSGIYKKDDKSGKLTTVESTPRADFKVSKDDFPAMFSTPWSRDKIIKAGPGKFTFVVAMLDSNGKYTPIASYDLDYSIKK